MLEHIQVYFHSNIYAIILLKVLFESDKVYKVLVFEAPIYTIHNNL